MRHGKAATRKGRSLRRCGGLVVLGLFLSGCAGQEAPFRIVDPAREMAWRIAVFPAENLSGRAVPAPAIRALLIETLKQHGVSVLDDADLESVLTQERLRYTAGVDRGIARALRERTGVEAILIPSVELYDEASPPRVAVFCRLVSTGDDPVIRWIDGVGLAGDDSPGILGLGVIEEPRALLTKALGSLTRSLAEFASAPGRGLPGKRGGRRFQPKIVYRSVTLDPEKKYSIAVVPFFNKSARKHAGEIVALHMIRNLLAFPAFEVVEPGIVRQELLKFRIIMSEGVSLPDTETILNALDADFVLNGEVMDYQDSGRSSGSPLVNFSVAFIERRSRKMVYSSYSHNEGNDGVWLFDWGRVNTAHAMASHMARAIGERMLWGSRPTQAGEASGGRGTTAQE